MVSSKVSFSNVMANRDGCNGLTDCEKYGMTWGCDPDCPVLNFGGCSIYKSVEDYLGEMRRENIVQSNSR